MRLFATLLLLFTTQIALSQTYSVTGNVVNENNKPIPSAIISVFQKDSTRHTTTTNKEGAFLVALTTTGKFYLSINAPGYEEYTDSTDLSKAPSGVFPRIILHTAVHMLDEVKIVEKIMAMVQKDDTLEFNSGAFKVNEDADAADMVRKMPTIEINDKQITAQGENVVKILVDGKPFFGTDPWAALKNLPADVIDKVQVYNEKSDQEQFTGFSEGATNKTINIITKPEKRNGQFGKIYAGGGGDPNNVTDGANGDLRYGSGLTLNEFAGDRRITLTGQSNNVNAQNFTDASASGGGGTGLSTTNAAGINYSDKWGKNMDISGSYFFNTTDNSVTSLLRKNYITSVDSGQIYNQSSTSSSRNQSHRFNMRFNYKIDSMNSILLTPSVSYNNNGNNSLQDGNTVLGAQPVNSTLNNNNNTGKGLNLSSNLLFRHRFVKKGRTFSVSVNTGGSNNNSIGQRKDTTTYYQGSVPSNTLNQRSTQNTQSLNLTGNITYTEPIGAKGQLKADYNVAYLPSQSGRYTYDYAPDSGTYSRRDDLYSNSFTSRNLAHTAGGSYMLHLKDADFSVGLNYQLTQLTSNQTLPVQFNLGQQFSNWLPVATFHYKITKSRNLQCTYNTNTQAPSVSQLQNVINNTDPLHLVTGNPDLKQPYRHNLVIRYNSTSIESKSIFSASLSGAYTQHNIASSSFIAPADTFLKDYNITMARGSQLTLPVNVDGNSSLTTNISYGIPLTFIKSRLNLSLNGGVAHIPGMVNGVINYQENKTGGMGITVSSNISEYVDFTLSSNTSLTANANSLNPALNTTYVNENARASVNLQSKSGFVFNTTLNYNTNSGLTAAYNQNYLLCNISLGKKVFKKHAGDIRLSVFDLFNQNNNIQHTIADVYIQDSRSNILQRYFLLMFTYKINKFSGQEAGEAGKG